ncbi:hypothetical protein BU24DRAFT_348313, partial [Aaosphaeria arxii CBS 175.79]
EKRLQRVENLVSQLVPGADIDELLNSPEVAKAVTPSANNVGTQAHEVSRTILPTSPQREGRSESHDPVLPEAVPYSADGFNWQEEDVTVDGLTDGMAALSVEPTGVGYLGKFSSTSGVVFLRCLLDWAGFLNQTRIPAQESMKQATGNIKSIIASSQLSHAALTTQVASTLMDTYFQDYHVCYPFVHEGTFRAQYSEIIPRPPQRSWDMLYHTILALGAWSLNNDQVGLEDYLYRRALTLGQHESVFEAANLATVQALVLLSNLSQKRNSPNTGWNLLGLAVRTALSLALHRELPQWNISLMDREIRRRVWWGLYIFDSGASTTFGRAIMLPDQDSMNVHPVLNVDDESLTPKTIELPEESLGPTFYSSLKTQSDLHMHTNHVSNRLLADPGLSAEAALSINSGMDAWTLTMPMYFRFDHEFSCPYRWYLFARSRIWWRFWNLKIIIFRHILLRRAIAGRGQTLDAATQSMEEECKKICIAAAHSTIISIHQYSIQGSTRLESWYATFFLFHAALVITLSIISFPNADDLSTWYDDVRLARSTFRENLIEDSLSARCVTILDRLVSDDPIDSNFFNNVPLDRDAMSTFPWSMEANELFDSFDWDLTTNHV